MSTKSECESCDCFRIMAYIYSKIGRKPNAKKYYELAIKYDPQDIDLLIEYATFLESVEIKEALNVYTKIMNLLKSNPELKVKPELFNNCAVTLIKNKKFQEAAQMLQKANEENKNNDQALDVFVRFNKGLLFESQGKYKLAIAEYTQVIKLNPFFQGTFD